MNYLNEDLFQAWAAGGMHAYCHLHSARKFALCARDYEAAAQLDWLEDVLDLKMASEIMASEGFAA